MLRCLVGRTAQDTVETVSARKKAVRSVLRVQRASVLHTVVGVAALSLAATRVRGISFSVRHMVEESDAHTMVARSLLLEGRICVPHTAVVAVALSLVATSPLSLRQSSA